MQTQTTDTLDATRRQDLDFLSRGTRCAAWFHPAHGVGDPAPIVVMAHGLSGTRRDGLGPFAERFAQAGIAALVFDHRGFGDSAGEPDLFHPRRQLEDWAAAIAFARSLPGVDPSRVATFGSSMGAGNALAAAALDNRIAAVVSQVPFLDMVTQAHRSSLGVSLRILGAAVRGRHLRAIGQPGEPAFINAPAGERGLAARRLDRRGQPLARPRVIALAARPAIPSDPPRPPTALPLARLRRRERPGGPPRTSDPRRKDRRAGRASHVPRRGSFRHLRRPRARAGRRRRGRVPAKSPRSYASVAPERSLALLRPRPQPSQRTKSR